LYLAEPKYYSSNNHRFYELTTNTGEVIIAFKNVDGTGNLVALKREHETHPMVVALRDRLKNDGTEFAESLKSGKRNAP
jgi:hypothetical protein